MAMVRSSILSRICFGIAERRDCLVGTPEPSTPSPAVPSTQQSTASSELASIQVRITYCVKNPVEGIQFVLPSDAYPYVSDIYSWGGVISNKQTDELVKLV